MKHRYRFFGEPPAPGQALGPWLIDGEECLHLEKVLRLQLGAEVELCDGQGLVASGVIRELGARKAIVEAEAGELVSPPSRPLTLVLGALKPQLVDDILPALVELGVDELQVFLSEQADKGRVQERVLARWQKIARTAVKQCKRPYLPRLSCAPSLASLVPAWAARPADARLHLSEKAATSLLALPLAPATAGLIAVVGGEKGLSPREEQLLAAEHFAAVSLGPYTLRAYTAAIAATAVLSMQRQAT